MYSLGEVLGPIIGGTLLQNYGFSLTSTVFSLLNLIMAIMGTLYFLLRKKSPKNCNIFLDQVSFQKYKQKNTEVIIGKFENGENGRWITKLK